MRRVTVLSLMLVLCSAVVLGEVFDGNFFLQKRRAHEGMRHAWRQKLAGRVTVQLAPAPGQEDFDVRFYELDLSIDPSTQTVTGTVTIRAESGIESLTQAVVNLSNTMTVTGVTGDASGYTHADDLLTINLDGSYGVGETFRVSIAYTGQPVEESGLGLHFDTHGGSPAVSTDSYPYFARSWWPCKDVPADKADSVNMIITVPEELIVVCNGILRSVTENPNNTKTYYWHEGYPISTYLVALAAAVYESFSDYYNPASEDPMEIQYYVFPEDYNDAVEDFDVTVGMMEYFVSIYGEYPFVEEKYGMASYLGTWGAMENQTITFYGNFLITGNHDYDDVVAHELAHMWWGDAVTNKDWHNTWLNEGFATYSEALYFGDLGGMGVYHQYMDVTLNALSYSQPIYRYETSDPFEVVAGVVYDKGAWVLHMLRHVVGDGLFFQILAEYRAQYEFGTVTTEDFQAVCEQVSNQDLSWFFQEWIYESWHPEYYWGWQVESVVGSDYLIRGFIDQIQEQGPVFTMPLDIGIVTTAGDTLYQTVLSDEQSETFQFTVGQEPAELLLDPYNWVLKEARGVTTPIVNYLWYSIDDDGDGDSRPDPGETVELTVEIVNSGVAAYGLSATLSTDDPDVTVTAATAEYGDVAHSQSAQNVQTPFLFSVGPSAETHLTKFDLTFTTPNGYTGVDSFYLTIGSPTLLLVNDDGGDSYETVYEQCLAANAIPFQMWDVSQEGAPGDTLSDFEMVVWFTGLTRDNTLTLTDQVALSSYLDSGGKLFLSGQDIGHDLVEMGNGAEFYTDYLRAEFVGDVSSDGFLQGVTDDPITGDLGLLLVGPDLESPDVIAPTAGASVTLEYSPSREAAGVKYGGDYRLVYFAVGLAGIDLIVGESGPMRVTLMSNILQWLQFIPTKGDVNEDGTINIIDVVWVVNIILGSLEPSASQYWAADFDDNGKVNIIDAIMIVNEILGPMDRKRG
ncbi:MAG: M1 family aminopeptidase [bacterium]